MKSLKIAVLLTISVYSFGQTLNQKRFRLAILVPDTMVIDGGLLEYAGAIEADHVKDYYRIVKDLEHQLESWKSRDTLNRFPMTKRTLEKRLDSLRNLEPEVKRYKFFYKIADYSLHHFKLLCGESSSTCDFLVIGTKTPSKKKFKEIPEKFNLDYLLRYSDIKAITKDKKYEIELTATLYSQNLKVLHKGEFTTTSNCPDDKLRCVTPLCCMMTNITKLSSTKIYATVELPQKK